MGAWGVYWIIAIIIINMNFAQKLQLPLFSKLINPQMVRTNNPVLFIMEKINYLTNLSMLQGGKFTLITTIAFCNSLICLFNLIMTGLHLQEHMEHWIYCNCSSSMPPLAFSLPTKSIMLPTSNFIASSPFHAFVWLILLTSALGLILSIQKW